MGAHGASKKILLSLAALGVAGAIAGLGTFATFTDTTSASQSVTAGTVDINLGSSGAANRFSVSATGVVPGDTIQRNIDLINAGNQNLASITLTSTAPTTTSLLDTDATNGLQMVIQNCSTTWTEAGVSPALTYSCSGTTTPVLASRAVIGNAITLSNLGSLTNGATDHLLMTLTLPSTAGNTFQAATSTVVFTFDAIQRAATNR
jgi:predicted ribosomally synthesized peptide with SipW-like signal peptide